jgi:threonine dehydratase
MAENGVSNGTHTPEPPSPISLSKTQHNSLALTEYSAEPSTNDPAPLVEDGTHKSIIPEHLLLPNGFPDVSEVVHPAYNGSTHFNITKHRNSTSA